MKFASDLIDAVVMAMPARPIYRTGQGKLFAEMPPMHVLRKEACHVLEAIQTAGYSLSSPPSKKEGER